MLLILLFVLLILTFLMNDADKLGLVSLRAASILLGLHKLNFKTYANHKKETTKIQDIKGDITNCYPDMVCFFGICFMHLFYFYPLF